MITELSIISSLVAMTALATGYGMSNSWLAALSVLVVGSLSLLGLWRRWEWSTSVVLVCCVGAAVGGFWLQASAELMLAGMVAALIAWDLARFDTRLRTAHRIEGSQNLVRQHLQRLLITISVALPLAVGALRVRAKLNFGTAFVAGLLAILGLSQAVRALRGIGD